MSPDVVIMTDDHSLLSGFKDYVLLLTFEGSDYILRVSRDRNPAGNSPLEVSFRCHKATIFA